MKIGKKVKDLRIKYRLTQKELAAKVEDGIDYTYIGRIERDLVLPSLKTLEKLAAALEVDVSYFFIDPDASETSTMLGAISKNETKQKLIQIIYKLDDNDAQLAIEIINLILKTNRDNL